MAESPCTFFQIRAVKNFADINYWRLRDSSFPAYRSAAGSLTSPHVINWLAVLSWRQYGGKADTLESFASLCVSEQS